MIRIKQVFVKKPRQLSELRLMEKQKCLPAWKAYPLFLALLAFGWIPACIAVFPFLLLFVWSIRKLSGY